MAFNLYRTLPPLEISAIKHQLMYKSLNFQIRLLVAPIKSASSLGGSDVVYSKQLDDNPI